MKAEDFRPGDRVVCISSYLYHGEFGTVAERSDIDAADAVPVVFDGADSVYRAMTAYSLRKLPPPWQPKAPIGYVVVSLEDAALSGIGDRASRCDVARANAEKDRGESFRVCAVVPVTEVIAPLPPVEVREL